MQLHTHSVNHDHLNEITHDVIAEHGHEHEHYSVKHLSIDASHVDHHDLSSVTIEDASPDTLFGQMSKKVFSTVFLILLVTLVSLGVLLCKGVVRLSGKPLQSKPPIYFIPLLRAPPK